MYPKAVATLLGVSVSSRGPTLQQNCRPIHFGRGQSSAVVKGIARSSDSVRWTPKMRQLAKVEACP